MVSVPGARTVMCLHRVAYTAGRKKLTSNMEIKCNFSTYHRLRVVCFFSPSNCITKLPYCSLACIMPHIYIYKTLVGQMSHTFTLTKRMLAVISIINSWWNWPRIRGFWNRVFSMFRDLTCLPLLQLLQIALLKELPWEAPLCSEANVLYPSSS